MQGSLQRILQEIMQKILLGTSDAWSTIRLSHRPSDPAYYIVNWRILWTSCFKVGHTHWQSFSHLFDARIGIIWKNDCLLIYQHRITVNPANLPHCVWMGYSIYRQMLFFHPHLHIKFNKSSYIAGICFRM